MAIHGYHVGVEDQAIYLPAILRDFDPSLYPHDSFFFEAQTRPTLIDETITAFVRLTHVPLDWTLLLFHLLTMFLLLLGAWRVARRCFPDNKDAWAGLGLLTGLFLIPIAGTSQFIVDQYLHPRALATGLILLPVADLLPPGPRMRRSKLILWCGFCFVAAFIFHLQMAAFGLGLLVFLAIPWERWFPNMRHVPVAALGIPILGRFFEPASAAWQEAARTRSQHYLMRWEWYELLGIIAPMFLFWWLGRFAEKKGNSVLAWFTRRIALYSLVVLVVGGALILPPAFERLTPFQPMRMFTFVYLYLLVLGGGLLGQFLLKRSLWRWLVLFVPIATGMYIGERAMFPASPHIEWPGTVPSQNPWVQAFLWVRQNTPKDAYFALNPFYYDDRDNDNRGFRAWAERSQMADISKDAGVASIVPKLAPRWQREVHALSSWDHPEGVDFPKLKQEFGVTWTILERTFPDGRSRSVPESLECPYQNRDLYVCKIR